ncbi:MAG: hypothetical protein M1825_001894 [Sarcosagium campestre]|nr:MAG: hypothetical protein M1825_001894 [Sarcosagium campestre]
MPHLSTYVASIALLTGTFVDTALVPRLQAPWTYAGVPSGKTVREIAQENIYGGGDGRDFSGPSLPPPGLTPDAALPTPLPTESASLIASGSIRRPQRPPVRPPGDGDQGTPDSCPVSEYFNAGPANWISARTDQWFDNWWKLNNNTAKKGIAQTLGQQFLRTPDFCADASLTAECTFDPCSQMAFLGMSPNLQPAYYVLESIKNLHAIFTGLAETLKSSSIGSALSSDGWARIFYVDKDTEDITFWKELANGLTTIVAISAALAVFVVPGGQALGVIAAGAVAFTGGTFASVYNVRTINDDTPIKAAELGMTLSTFFTNSMQQFLTANDQLMAGEAYGDVGDLRSVFTDGNFVDLPGVNGTTLLPAWNNLMTAAAINTLWRAQKVFILGGIPCNVSLGIGDGPDEAYYCKEGKAYWLYYWREFDGPKLGKILGINWGKKQWGQADKPPGLDQLGKSDTSGDYSAINVQSIINSSVDASNIAGVNYTPETARNRTMTMLKQGRADPLTQGVSWEGTFTIPVCDISLAATKNFPKKSVMLQPYGKNMVPQWCGSICGTAQQTADFIKAANMEGFESPYAYCPKGYKAGHFDAPDPA